VPRHITPHGNVPLAQFFQKQIMTNSPFIQLIDSPLAGIDTDWLVVALFSKPEFPENVQVLDHALGGALSQLRERNDLKAKAGELTYLPVVSGISTKRVLVIGLGEPTRKSLTGWEQAVLTAARKAAGTADSSIAIVIPEEMMTGSDPAHVFTTSVAAALVGSSGQAIYKETPERFAFQKILLVSSFPDSTGALERGRILGECMNLTRELVNRHPEEMVPVTFAARAEQEANAAGLEIEIFDRDRLESERMGSLLAVARGSIHEPRVVVLKYQGAGKDAPVLALCGKGVTFDSGGLSIKPSDSMITMKGDMAGAATVLGAMVAMARLKLPVNVIGAVGLVENMIGPHSFKLGEVLTARNGVTIEVHNTDAEGRLVLADVLAYLAEQKPARMIDLATLTGACVVALGMDIAGAMTNNQPWCDTVLQAARDAGEQLWQLPLNDSFSEQLKSDFADIKNVGSRWGGAITAAKFLERFVNEIPWVHLDIAGPSFAESGKPWRDLGGTASSLRTLVEVAERFSGE